MNKFLLFLLSLCLAASQSKAQNNAIVLDYSAPLKLNTTKVDVNKPLLISLKHCDIPFSKTFQVELLYKSAALKPVKLDCSKETSVPIKSIFKDKTNEITFTILADQKKEGDKGYSFSFYVQPDGVIAASKIQPGAVQPNGAQPITPGERVKEFSVDFLSGTLPAERTAVKQLECRYPMVTYDLCCNCYKIRDMDSTDTTKKKEVIKGSLRYYSRAEKNKGVVFLVKNINTFIYDVTVGSEYENLATEEPELFKTVYTLISGGTAEGQSAADDELKAEMARQVKLNADLKRYLAEKIMQDACPSSDQFEKEKIAIGANIIKVFGPGPVESSFAQNYERLKAEFIKQNESAEKPYDFNKEVQDLYSLPITPDSLVRETRKVLLMIMNTKFEYQYNIPQLDNADFLNFSLNIEPKKDKKGNIRVLNQPISIPIRGGVKVDFSTGLYYSSISNSKYALRDYILTDTLRGKDIRGENGDQNGKGTVGVMALMHVYPRLGDLQPAFSFGFGKALDLNYSVLAGGSIMFGKRNRFALSGGINFSSVKVLSAKYFDDQGVLIRQPKEAGTLDTFNKIKTGGFIGFSYSLSGKKTQQAAAADSPPKKDAGQ